LGLRSRHTGKFEGGFWDPVKDYDAVTAAVNRSRALFALYDKRPDSVAAFGVAGWSFVPPFNGSFLEDNTCLECPIGYFAEVKGATACRKPSSTHKPSHSDNHMCGEYFE